MTVLSFLLARPARTARRAGYGGAAQGWRGGVRVDPLVGTVRAAGVRDRGGYGRGSFVRTPAASQPRPLVLGTGHRDARLPTTDPQPHDIRLDAIVTGAGTQRRSTA